MANEGWLAVFSLGVTLTLLTLLSLLRDWLFPTIGRGLLFRVYAGPGVLVHELSHTLYCNSGSVYYYPSILFLTTA